jgi:hypothetical protein
MVLVQGCPYSAHSHRFEKMLHNLLGYLKYGCFITGPTGKIWRTFLGGITGEQIQVRCSEAIITSADNPLFNRCYL